MEACPLSLSLSLAGTETIDITMADPTITASSDPDHKLSRGSSFRMAIAPMRLAQFKDLSILPNWEWTGHLGYKHGYKQSGQG